MKNKFKIVEDDFIIQSCYYIDDVIKFNIGFKSNSTWIYESGCYYSFENVFIFDNTERDKKDRNLVQSKLNVNKDFIVNKLKELIYETNQHKPS